MFTRFKNPHLAQQDYRITSRAEVFSIEAPQLEDDENIVADENEIYTLLGKRIYDTLDFGEYSVPTKSRKKQKTVDTTIDTGEAENSNEKSPAIYLTSKAHPPISLILEPKTIPLAFPQYREPPVEDSETEADVRAQRAASVSVDVDWLVQESTKLLPANRRGTVIDLSIPVPSPHPPAMVVESGQEARSTRPPVDTAPPLDDSKLSPTKPLKLPVLMVPTPSQAKRDCGTYKARPIPQPTFWRPQEGLGGKCRGYALGYPSNWSSRADDPQSTRRWYTRDTMKKASFV